MDEGKKICEKTRKMRKRFAEANGIDYEFTECTYGGPCDGTCILCEVEMAELQALAEEKSEKESVEIIYPKELIQEEELSGEDVELPMVESKFSEQNRVLMGMMKAPAKHEMTSKKEPKEEDAIVIPDFLKRNRRNNG